MKKPIDRVLMINSFCTVGKVSITNMMPIMSVRGIEACPMPSIVLSSHTEGFKDIATFTGKTFIEDATRSMKENNIYFDLNYIGYLGNIENINQTQNYLKEVRDCINIIDPIFADDFKLYSGFDMNYVYKIRELLKYSHIITPNFTEALFLTGREKEIREIYNEDYIKDIIYDLRELGAKNIIITSVPSSKENELKIAVFDGENLTFVTHEKMKKSYTGTGDIFAGVLCTEVLRGTDLVTASRRSGEFVKDCIEYSMQFDYPAIEGVLLEKQLYRLI